MATLVLISSDNVPIEVDRKAAYLSSLIKMLAEDETEEHVTSLPITGASLLDLVHT